MQLDKKLRTSLGIGTNEVAKLLGVSPSRLRSWSIKKEQFLQVLIKGLEVGSKWVDFQDSLEKKGFVIVSTDGTVSHASAKSDLGKTLKKYGISSAYVFCDICDISMPYARKLYKEDKALFHYLFWGATYVNKFKHVEKSYKEMESNNE